jgi:hypothetical protein
VPGDLRGQVAGLGEGLVTRSELVRVGCGTSPQGLKGDGSGQETLFRASPTETTHGSMPAWTRRSVNAIRCRAAGGVVCPHERRWSSKLSLTAGPDCLPPGSRGLDGCACWWLPASLGCAVSRRASPTRGYRGGVPCVARSRADRPTAAGGARPAGAEGAGEADGGLHLVPGHTAGWLRRAVTAPGSPRRGGTTTCSW